MIHLIYLAEKGELHYRCGEKYKLKKGEAFRDHATVWLLDVSCPECMTACENKEIRK